MAFDQSGGRFGAGPRLARFAQLLDARCDLASVCSQLCRIGLRSSVVIENTSSPRWNACSSCTVNLWGATRHAEAVSAYTTALVSFLVLALYMLGVSLLQGLGMLLMYLVFPSFMKLVYPSRLGQLHTVVLGLYRR